MNLGVPDNAVDRMALYGHMLATTLDDSELEEWMLFGAPDPDEST